MMKLIRVGLCVFAFVQVANAADPKPPVGDVKYKPGDRLRPRPTVVDPPTVGTEAAAGRPPGDATVLFDGRDLSRWAEVNAKDPTDVTRPPQWVVQNGYGEARGGQIQTRAEFADCHIHLEFRMSPEEAAEPGRVDQNRGNSGIVIGDHPEVQILDGYDNDTYPDGQAAAIYGHWPPLVNACRKPGEWQTYDIYYNAPRFDGPKKVQPATYTVVFNGLPVHLSTPVPGEAVEGRLRFKPHGGKVRYRNIWVRPLHRYDENAGKPLPPGAHTTDPLAKPKGDKPPVTYTIPEDEVLNGPKPADSKVIVEGKDRTATITVDAAKVKGRVNPLQFGACFEDLNHEIYGGLYAQMIYGESFEEGPETALPAGWRTNAGWLDRPTWQGMWWHENDAVGMVGFRRYKLLYKEVPFGDGAVSCELMQPTFDPGKPIGLVFRAGGIEFRDAYVLALDAARKRLVLRKGDKVLATAEVSAGFDQWLAVRVEVAGGEIRAFAGGAEKPVIRTTDPEPLMAGLVGFDASELRGWFRKLKIDAGGAAVTPGLAPVHPRTYRGPVSQWWDPIVTGDAEVEFAWDADRPFNTLRSQKITLKAGTGTAGVANRGLHRYGLSVVKGRAYEGRLYLRGGGDVTVALQSGDGLRTHASQRLTGVGAERRKFSFALTSADTDPTAQFAFWIDKPGAVWVDQVVLMPTGDALFKGLPVRADIAKAVIDSGITCIRLGGDYSGVPGFKWKTMLGDPDQRSQYNSCWYPFESRGWGIGEFIEFCRAAGIEPIPCLNHDETPADVAELVRRQKLNYVQLGNGCALLERNAAVADAIHAVHPGCKLLTGSIGHQTSVLPNDTKLNELKKRLGGKTHALAVFPYNSEVYGPAGFQAMLERLAPLRDTMKVYVQEVNGGNHNLLRGLTDAAFANVCEQNADVVDLVTYCNMLAADGTTADNGWDQGRIFFDNRRVWLQPHGWTLKMARDNSQPVAVETRTTSPTMTFRVPPPNGVTAADVLVASASKSEKGDVLAIKVVNLAPFAITSKVRVEGMAKLAPTAATVVLTGSDLKRDNTAEEPTRVVPNAGRRDGIGPEFNHVFPAYSYTILTVRAP